MFGKTVFIITILLWGLITITLVEASRQKKDVHHMIFLNESKRPSKKNRHQDYEHHDYHKENRPKKSRKKPAENKHNDPTITEDSIEESSYEEFVQHKPKTERNHHQHTHHPDRYHKRHNSQRHHSDHKKHHMNDRHNHRHSKPKEYHKFVLPDNWIPMSSKELFRKEHDQYLRGNGLGQYTQGYIQSIPLQITTPLPIESISSFHLQSTIYPPLSFMNERVQNSNQSPLVGTVETYKPFDYSILEQKHENPSGGFQEQEVSSSNIVNVKHSGGRNGNPFSIIVESPFKNLENKEKSGEKDNKSEEEEKVVKSEKPKGKGKRMRESSRYRIKNKN